MYRDVTIRDNCNVNEYINAFHNAVKFLNLIGCKVLNNFIEQYLWLNFQMKSNHRFLLTQSF